jgi:hypothetical protein
VQLLYRILIVLSVILVFGAGRASADSLSYAFAGPVSVSFELPVNPTVTDVHLGGGFAVTPINLTLNGAPSNDILLFFNAAFGGAFAALSCPSCADLALAGPQMYSGSEAAPTMLVLSGATLVDDKTGAPSGTITSTPASTPEPPAFILLGIGLLALVGTALVAKRSSGLPVAAN